MQLTQRAMDFADPLFNFVEKLFYTSQSSVDNSTHAFYIFKPWPLQLNQKEMTNWQHLQQDVLSPFKNSFVYSFASAEGIHLWYAKTSFLGIPETAITESKSDGMHNVKSNHFSYKQQWRNGIMIACVAQKIASSSNGSDFSDNANATSQSIDNVNDTQSVSAKPWAVKRHIDSAITEPITWYKLSAMIFALIIIWLSVGWLTLTLQAYFIDKENEALTSSIGPRLEQRQQLTNSNEILKLLDDWQRTPNNFPIALGKTLSVFKSPLLVNDGSSLNTNKTENGLTNLHLNSFQWQNNKMTIEFNVAEVNITKLVEISSALEGVQSANIKPHNAPQTWILEVQW